MAITVKKIVLWRKEVDNKPGTLAAALAPLAEAGVDLQVVMGTGHPGNESRAEIGVFPVTGRKSQAAAETAGFKARPLAALLVGGDNKPGLAHGISRMIAEAGINISFVIAQVIGRKFSAVFGFQNDADAGKAATLIRKLGAARKPATKKAPPAKKAPARKR